VAIGAVPPPAYASPLEGDRGTPNAAILEIVDSRAARLPGIDRHKAAGVIGESNLGLVEIVDLDAVDDPDARAEVERLVRAENADREKLYALLASGGAGEDRDARLRTIREKYAEILRADAHAGDWIQLPDGAWERKKNDERD